MDIYIWIYIYGYIYMFVQGLKAETTVFPASGVQEG